MKFIEKFGIIKKEPQGVNYCDTDCEHDELGVVDSFEHATEIVELLNENNKREGVYFYIKTHRYTEFDDVKDFFDININYGVDSKNINFECNTEDLEK
ncbi:MAG: hypothetical protein PHS54_04485 [Clostridia bacterium]|nr:hypothetical protein [Clostridia bacterium]